MVGKSLLHLGVLAGAVMLVIGQAGAATGFGARANHALLKLEHGQRETSWLRRTPLPRSLRKIMHKGRSIAGKAAVTPSERRAETKIHQDGFNLDAAGVTYHSSFREGAALQQLKIWGADGFAGKELTTVAKVAEGLRSLRHHQSLRRGRETFERRADGYEAHSTLTSPTGLSIPRGSWAVALTTGQQGQEGITRYTLWQWKDGAGGRVRSRSTIGKQDFEHVMNTQSLGH